MDTYNLYEYAASRPTVLTDPTGRQFSFAGSLSASGIQAQLAGALLVSALGAFHVSLALQDALDSYSFSLSLNVRATELLLAGQAAAAEALFAVVAVFASGDFDGKTVAEIIAEFKQGRIKNTALPPGGPGWKEILQMTWEEIVKSGNRASRGRGRSRSS